MRIFIISFLLVIAQVTFAKDLPLNKIQLPSGFSIHLYARVANARQMALGNKGIIYVGSRSAGKVYALIPNANRTQAKAVKVIASGLKMPTGVAYENGNLYVAAVDKIYVYKNIDENLNDPKAALVTDKLPDSPHHGWRYIAFGPDGWLYIASGAPCNVCLSKNPYSATILRMKPNGNDLQIYAKGVRNTVGFDWNPVDNKLWFTDNGRDWLGDHLPPDELNFAPQSGLHFGFPYYYGNNAPDPKYGRLAPKGKYVSPVLDLDPHVAALGMKFYTGKMFPTDYHNAIFIAEHGSWNRSKKIGYRVILVKLEGNKPVSRQVFAKGWLQGQNEWGRPVDLLVLPDGSLLLSDDDAGAIYRITYQS